MTLSAGIHAISMTDYCQDPCEQPSLSAGVAHTLLTKSPAHARMQHPRLYPGYAPDEDSRFDLGSAAHALLLEGDGSSIVWVPHEDWRSGAARTSRIDARAQGKLPVLKRYQGVLQEMVRVAREAVEQSEFKGLFDGGTAEATVIWQEDGTWMRCRPDWWSADRKIMINYKTAASAAPEPFIRQIGNMGYDLASEFYLRGCRPHGAEHHIFLAQEIESPFACALYTLSAAYQEIAEEKTERAINLWRMCLAADKWPAYSLRLHHAEPPSWELNAFEARMAEENW